MFFQSRKKLRLEGYGYNTAGAYFVTVCTADRKPLLCTIPRVGADDHIGPNDPSYHVGADDYIGPNTQLTEIGTVVDKYTRTIPGIDRYVIMPNHVHMIILISQEGTVWSPSPTCEEGTVCSPSYMRTNLQTRIRTWKTLISKELGRSVWQRSYYDHVIRNERDYVEKAQYILNNPAKWCEDQYYPGY